MIRRLLILGFIVYVAALVAKANTKLAADHRKDRHAVANWDDEGGSPAPDPVDTPITA